jgi:RNA polymerase sigma-70 factor (ECF subfamily)
MGRERVVYFAPIGAIVPSWRGTVTDQARGSAPAPDDLALISAYTAGDAGAFDILFQRYHARVRAVCLRYVGDDALADDLVQETFYNVIRALARVDEGFNFGAWIHRIAVNVCQDELRRRNRRAIHVDHGGDPEEAMLKIADRDRTGHPEDALEISSLRQLVWDVAKRLPERQRMVLTLRELQGLSYTAIARVMGITDAAVETLLHRARKRFKEEYLRLESPAEERATNCPELEFIRSRGRLTASGQQEALEHLETCALCRNVYQATTLDVRAPRAVVTV